MKKPIVFVFAIALSCALQAAQVNNGCQGNCPTTTDGGGSTTVSNVKANADANAKANANSTSTSNSSSSAGAISASSMNTNNVSGIAGGSGGAGGAGGNSSSDNSVYIEATKRGVQSAYAPAIAPTALCSGSSSAGAQGAAFGVSFGSTWTDENCMLLERVRMVAGVLNDIATASEMMCSLPSYREARERQGRPCAAGKTAKAVQAQTGHTDPYVRARLGLHELQ